MRDCRPLPKKTEAAFSSACLMRRLHPREHGAEPEAVKVFEAWLTWGALR